MAEETVHIEGLACPSCLGPLASVDEVWRCAGCGAEYGACDGLWDLTTASASGIPVLEREHYTDNIEFYLQMHSTWQGSPFYRHYHSRVLDHLKTLPAGSMILELGCGLGHDGLALLRSGYRLVETDIAPGQLLEARRLHSEEGFSAGSEHLLANAQHLPFAGDSFDGAMMVAMLHHLPDPVAALREVRRVLKPGGMLVLGTEPNTWQHTFLFPAGKRVLHLAYRLMGKKSDPGEMVSAADKETEGFSRYDLDYLFIRSGFERWRLEPAGFLSAAAFFAAQEFSEHFGVLVRLFWLERMGIAVDEWLERIGGLKNYPWHWNAVAFT